MTEGEKRIWAAAYAANWAMQYYRQDATGIKRQITECIENADAAVDEAREAISTIEEGWGANSTVATRLREALE